MCFTILMKLAARGGIGKPDGIQAKRKDITHFLPKNHPPRDAKERQGRKRS
jgi:hypothetical protein